MKIINLLSWIGLFLTTLFFVSICLHTDTAINQDMGRHFVLGKIILKEKLIPKTNLFSYTYPSFPFINHHWGSEVVFYLLDKKFSINGLIITKTFLLTVAFSLLFFYAAKRSNLISTIITGIFAITLFRARTEVRPEIFACFFFAAFLIIFYSERKKKGKLIWMLPFLELFWINFHISFIFGLVIYFFFLADRFLLKKTETKYFILGLILFFACFFNPSGWNGLIYPFKIFQNYGYSVVENQSVFFLEKYSNSFNYSNFKLSFFLFVVATPFLITRYYFFETAVVFLFGLLSFLMVRNLPFFALSLIYPLSIGLTLVGKKMASFLDMSFLKENFSWLNIGVYIALIAHLIFGIFDLVTNRYYKTRFFSKRFGLGQVSGYRNLVKFYVSKNLTGPIFNNFDVGSYLIYGLYPDERVFVDGRPEAYPISFFQDVYIPMQEDEKIWKDVERKYKFKSIIFSHTDMTPWGRKFLYRILNDEDWVLVYFDDYGVVLTLKDLLPKNIDPIDTKDKLKNVGILLIRQINEPDALLRLASFFETASLSDLEVFSKLKMNKLIND